MAKGFKHGACGNPLNFKVVKGLTHPGTAAENTIWVKTEKIGTWCFSATQPEGMQEWDVWIQTGTSSAVEFNALKKNGIQVYPISAKQYVSGAWVNVTAKSYQNGEWVDWIISLYNAGDLCEDVTGGWGAKAMPQSESEPLKLKVPTFKNENNRLVASIPGGWYTGVVWTKKNIDLTNHSMIEATGYRNGGQYAILFVAPENASYWSSGSICKADLNPQNSKVSVDISTVSGSYRVGFALVSNDEAQTIYIDKVEVI